MLITTSKLNRGASRMNMICLTLIKIKMMASIKALMTLMTTFSTQTGLRPLELKIRKRKMQSNAILLYNMELESATSSRSRSA